MSKHLSKDKSESLFNKFVEWRNKLLDLQQTIIVVEGKRDIEVLKKLGVTEQTNKIIGYSQISFVEFEELIQEGKYKDRIIIPLVDFDRQGEEYLVEIQSLSNNVDLELRREVRNLTRGKLQEFEDLLYILEDRLHPKYWLVLCQLLQIAD